MRILLTGSRGFLGKSVFSKLLSLEEVEIFAPSSSEVNLFSIDSVRSYIIKNKIDTVIHLAAKLGGVGLVSQKPLSFFEENLQLNYNIVKVSIEENVQKFITIGSSCSYAGDALIPTPESVLWKGRPENSYGVCKLALLEHLRCQDKMEWVYLIPPNIYGIGDHFGERDAHLIPATLKKFMEAQKSGDDSIVVWGDGSQVRDFIYVDDVAEIVTRSINDEAFSYKPINISTNTGVSVREIVEMLSEYMNYGDVDIHYDTSKPTGTQKKILDNSLLMNLLPNYSFVSFADGMKRVCEWIKKNKYLFDC